MRALKPVNIHFRWFIRLLLIIKAMWSSRTRSTVHSSTSTSTTTTTNGIWKPYVLNVVAEINSRHITILAISLKDDDTFVFVDNLRYFLSKKNSTDPFNYGFNFPWSYYQSGGAGYVVGNRAMKLLGKALLNQTSNVQCPNTGVEDQDMSNCFTMCSDVKRGGAMDALDRPLFNPWHYKDSASYLGSKVKSKSSTKSDLIRSRPCFCILGPKQSDYINALYQAQSDNACLLFVDEVQDKQGLVQCNHHTGQACSLNE